MQGRHWREFAIACVTLTGCGRDTTDGQPAGRATHASSAKPIAAAPASAKAATRDEGNPEEGDEPPELAPAVSASGTPLAPASTLLDVGPAGPAAATSSGVVMIGKDDRVHVARIDPAARKPTATIEAAPESFAPFGRGPAIVGRFAYWISKGRLVRRRFDVASELQVLAEDAREGTRVAAAPSAHIPPSVAYIARQSGGKSLVAKLWMEGTESILLSAEGAAANSVAMASAGSHMIALSLEGRTSMSPVHARTIGFDATKPKLGEDVVAWVGASAQPQTEIVALEGKDTVWGFLAMERDATRFGLARLHIGREPHMSARVTWRLYPNGMDPAPVTAGRVCGKPSVVYVRPTAAAPHSPQELHLAPVEESGIGTSRPLSHARVFSDVTLASAGEATLVVYVADRRTWALILPCPS